MKPSTIPISCTSTVSRLCLSFSKQAQKRVGNSLFLNLVSTDEEKASGFFDSKSLRKSLFSGFVFTGKERDEETGYGYFGARYMDHELMTMWLSVDRYANKYPSISPYAYCAWNPITLTDPTGDTLDIRGGELAQNDILSVVAEQYRERISFCNNRVSVNAEGLSDEEIEQDAGLSLLYRLTKSGNHYLYQAEEVLNKRSEPIDLWNNSITPFREFQKVGSKN